MRRYEFDSIWTTTRRENQNSFGLYKKRKTISHSLCEWCGYWYWYWYWLSAAQKVSNLSSEMAKRAHVQTDRFIYLVKSLRDRVCSAMGNESAKHAGRQAGKLTLAHAYMYTFCAMVYISMCDQIQSNPIHWIRFRLTHQAVIDVL